VGASAGNFGQGLAWAGTRRGLPVTVFAATSANPLKVARMRALGATVVLEGRDFDAAKDAARAHVSATPGTTFVEDGREPAIAEGAGTIALELLRDAAARGLAAPDVLLVPLGNGALLAGIAHWMRAHAPATRLVAVCAAGAPAMARSIAEQRLVTTAAVDTIADGIGVRVPVPEALDDLRGMVDEVRLVGDDAIVEAMRLLWRVHGVVVEPAGAAALAALVAEPSAFGDATVATPLCGGNVTDEQVARWLLAP
jgi:threonine dehydratase